MGVRTVVAHVVRTADGIVSLAMCTIAQPFGRSTQIDVERVLALRPTDRPACYLLRRPSTTKWRSSFCPVF